MCRQRQAEKTKGAPPGRGALLSSRRVLLRYPQPGDARAFLAMATASQAFHRPWIYPPDTEEAFLAYAARADSRTFKGLLVCGREDGHIVGVYNISQIFYGAFCSAYLGYFANQAYAGRGLMAEGLGLVLRYAFCPLGLHRLEANIQPGNTDSIRLVRGVGFRREGFSPKYLKVGGVWRDHERWALIKEHWRELGNTC